MEIGDESAAGSTTDVGPEPETVLVVDDDRAVLNGLSELLESEGYAVATAIDGLEALNLPVIVITAAGFSEASVKTQFGDIELVAKPPPERQLLDAIQRRCGEPLH